MTLTIIRHPDASTLLSFSAGSLAEPLAAATAAHLSLCTACRADVRDLELLGAALLIPEPLSETTLAKPVTVPERPSDGIASAWPKQRGSMRGRELLPDPIAERYGLTLETVPWKRLAPGVLHHRLSLSPGIEGDLRILKIAAGARMPEHGHGGAELTLVIDGAYADVSGEYRRGDMQDVSDDIEHRPIADAKEGCICLIASERPARFKGIMGRLLQPWIGM
jgi:putative transcriptional regulator